MFMSNKNKIVKAEKADVQGRVPKMRFPEFRDAGSWEIRMIGEFVAERSQSPIEKIPLYSLTIESGVTPKTERYKRSFLVKDEADAYKVACPDDFAYNPMNLRFGAIARHSGVEKVALSKYYNIFYCDKTVDSIFCEIYFRSNGMVTLYDNIATGSLIEKRRVHFSEFLKLSIRFPGLLEQQKIADCLSSIDELITANVQKLDTLKAHKKGLMQQLFPAEGETVPKLRFPEFRDAGAWEEKTLDKCLDYKQPTDYLVSDTKYSDAYKTPVLTAGKTFILGYTNEQHGIFSDNLPVIIFDDFTTATQFVDFPFKTKSSAMKILQAKNEANIKFMYEIMQMIAYEVGVHERHWISKFAPMSILIPYPTEQKRIADCLSSIDELITANAQKLDTLKAHKKGLMQQLFPSTYEVNV
jgi:type I restriction enzyme, S subunit